MLRLSKKADYALIAMKHLSLRGDGSSSAREIASLYDIPIELLAKILQRLVRGGLLASHQGTRGGYQLARVPAQIVRVLALLGWRLVESARDAKRKGARARPA